MKVSIGQPSRSNLGIGPGLQRVHHSKFGSTSIVAIDYLNPDWAPESDFDKID
ncbi:hypothetical protein ACVIW2_000675 [Bradyrhizobium huanghuaihaiense]|uniref:Uncharacterized protein n=1 Tax=Bradyrhizobium huanghuaihaiense TaxID=990078 RepID=A0A562RXM3_9BRAD|nr:hypothetical protein [Bradyrhizobium huanghuaihaiense]TWI73424.1 hypothetical protein IQ16_01560 [Bradyrhizobium huanghuaihaiense]